MNDIKEKIIEIIEEFSNANLNQVPTSETFNNLSIDSLSLLEIIFEIEEYFDITIPDEKGLVERGFSMSNIDDLIHLVTELTKEK